MLAKRAWNRRIAGLVALACAGIPLITMVTYDPHTRTFDFFRDDDHGDFGFLDGFLFDDCFFDDCFYKEEIIIFD